MKNFVTLMFLVFMATLSSCGSIQPTSLQPSKEESETAIAAMSPIENQNYESGEYSVKSTLPAIKSMAKIANCLLTKDAFFYEISTHKQFDYTEDVSPLVAEKLGSKIPVVVSSYCKKFTKTLAYRNIGSNIIYVNTCKQSKPSAGLLNTLWHERSHVGGYGHGDNYANGKGNSVPYGTGDIAEKYYEECKTQAGVL